MAPSDGLCHALGSLNNASLICITFSLLWISVASCLPSRIISNRKKTCPDSVEWNMYESNQIKKMNPAIQL